MGARALRIAWRVPSPSRTPKAQWPSGQETWSLLSQAARSARLTSRSSSLGFMATSSLEADFLERLGGVPVETGGLALVATTSCEIP